MSDDGLTVCGEVFEDIPNVKHGHGTRWLLTPSNPPAITRASIPFLSTQTKDNPALGISPDGGTVTGFNTYLVSPPNRVPPPDTDAYAVVNGVQTFYRLRFLRDAEQVTAIARSAADGGMRIVGYGSTGTNIYTQPCRAIFWGPGISGPWTPIEIDALADRPPSTRAYDITADGRAIVGSAASPTALTVYPEAGLAEEAVLWTSSGSSYAWHRTWLGFPSTSARHHSVAFGVASDGSSAGGFVIVGASGGTHVAGVPTETDRHDLDRRPTRWRVTGATVLADQLPLLRASQYVSEDMVAGSASAVSRGGSVVVGICSRQDASGDYHGEATIWGWDPAQPRSIREILLRASVTAASDVELFYASGVSADGLTVCGSGIDATGRLFAWVARLPPFFEPSLLDLDRIPRKLPKFVIDPLLR